MPRVIIRLSSGDTEEIRELPVEDALQLVEEFQGGDSPVLTLLVGSLGIHDIVHIARRHIVSVTVEGVAEPDERLSE